jgi:hypothetical protein
MSTTRIIALIILLTPALSNGQNLFIGGGVNGYFISNPIDDAASFMRRGYQIGADAMFGSVFFARGGIYFTGTETSLEFDNSAGATVNGSINATHLRIPIQGGVRVYDKDHLSVFVQSGPSGMIALSYDHSDIVKDIMTNSFRSLQWGWTFGGGIRINFMEFSLSYDTGLSRTFGDEASRRSRFGLLQLSVGFTM